MRSNGAGALTRNLYDTITGIQPGEVEDQFGWTRTVETQADLSAAVAGH